MFVMTQSANNPDRTHVSRVRDNAEADVLKQVRAYYGQTLTHSRDLKTSACCGATPQSEQTREILSLIAAEVQERFYGCGSPLPPALTGLTVLDVGCGTGRDSFLAARLVGESGRVIGVDMTPEQLEVAWRYQDKQAHCFGYAKPNTRFVQGFIEDLAAVDIAAESIDVVISNCVINLSPAKERVFQEIYRVLKPGGELYFADIFVNRRMPEALQKHPVLRGECLGGALYHEDFRRLLQRTGWPDFRVVEVQNITVDDPQLAQMLCGFDFESRTIRAIKSELLEDRAEQYGHVAQYLGNLERHEAAFALDKHHVFEAGIPVAVSGNTAAMLQESRFARYFLITGDRSVHYGLFDNNRRELVTGTCSPTNCCSPGGATDTAAATKPQGRCC
jgi:SAM-dependent methyltransferase